MYNLALSSCHACNNRTPNDPVIENGACNHRKSKLIFFSYVGILPA